jgi:hypothetical protein
MGTYIPDDELKLVVDAYEANGKNKAQAAEALGLPVSTFKHRLRMAEQRNLTGHAGGGPVGEGYVLGRTSTLYDMETGEAKLQWVRRDPSREVQLETLIDTLTDTFESFKGLSNVPEAPLYTQDNLLTVYPVADPHLGMYAWAKEAGENYDLGIARHALTTTASTLMASTPPSRVGLILGLGDFFHADTNAYRTPHSGNELDGDGRYAKILQSGVELVIFLVDQALQKHEKVLVRMLPGNHDPYATLALSVALGTFYTNNERVLVDTSPNPFFHFEWGKVMIAATHGDQVKPEDMAGVMASFWPEVWGSTTFRYAYLGHVHHKSKGGGERHGVEWETFQALTPKDAWHYGRGYASGRAMSAITIDRDHGEVIRHKVNIVKGEHDAYRNKGDS